LAALAMVLEWGIPRKCFRRMDNKSKLMIRVTVKNITLLCILASSPGLKHIRAEHPDLEVPVFVLSRYSIS
jgi:hypothetical protein